MKKLIALLLAAVMVFGLVACGSGNDAAADTDTKAETETPADDKAAETDAEADAEADAETPAEDNKDAETPADGEAKSIKVGLVCIGDENDQGYTYNFIRGKDAATEALAAKGINVEWLIKYNIGDDTSCEDANLELA